MTRNPAIDIDADPKSEIYRAWYLPTMQHGVGASPEQACGALYELIRREGIGPYTDYKRSILHFEGE